MEKLINYEEFKRQQISESKAKLGGSFDPTECIEKYLNYIANYISKM